MFVQSDNPVPYPFAEMPKSFTLMRDKAGEYKAMYQRDYPPVIKTGIPEQLHFAAIELNTFGASGSTPTGSQCFVYRDLLRDARNEILRLNDEHTIFQKRVRDADARAKERWKHTVPECMIDYTMVGGKADDVECYQYPDSFALGDLLCQRLKEAREEIALLKQQIPVPPKEVPYGPSEYKTSIA